MYSLPEEQNKLLKEMSEIEAQERAGILPVRNNLTLFLIGLSWTIGTVAIILNTFGIRQDNTYVIIGITIGISACLAISYYGYKIGLYLTAIAFTPLSLLISRVAGFENTAFVILLDSIALFAYSNLFGRNGYIIGSAIFLTKIILIGLYGPHAESLESLLSQVVNTLAIGIIPVLMHSTSRVSIKAKKQEIRAQILALQNQDLIGSWGNMFSGAKQGGQG
jgi:hypothetical protein